ncbi:hypothetical protein V3C99_006234 [Haemonchus contortus]
MAHFNGTGERFSYMQMTTSRSHASNDSHDSYDTMVSLPNIPVEPRNGMIRTYENHDRTFTRPYSAKTVFFYKEGDEYFTGVRVPVSKSRYRNFDSLLDDLNANIQMPFGVRRLTTPMGRTSIKDIDQLQHLGKYVATSSKYSRGLNLSALERLKKAREQTHQSLRREQPGGQSYWIPTSPTYKQKLRMSRTLGFSVVPSKQVFFVLNGKGRYYRALLNPLRLPPMEVLLQEVSEGLEAAIFRLYSVSGSRIHSVSDIVNLSPPKVIACTRIERPVLSTTMLPTIEPHRYAPKLQKSGSDSSNTASSSAHENGIEKKSRMFTNAVKRNTRRTTGAQRKKVLKALPAIVAEKTTYKADDTDSGKANSISSRLTDTPKMDEEPEFAFNEELEKTLKEAEKHQIAEDDESSDEMSLSARYQDSGRENSISSSRSKEADVHSRISEEELPSTSGGNDTRRSAVSSAEKKAEMLRKERMESHDDENDLIRDPDSDPTDDLESDREKGERRASETSGKDDGDEEIRPSTSEEKEDKEEDEPPPATTETVRSAQSNREEILPSDNEEEGKEHEKVPSDDEGAEEEPEEDKSLLLPTVITVPATGDGERAATASSEKEEILPSDDEEPSNHDEVPAQVEAADDKQEEVQKSDDNKSENGEEAAGDDHPFYEKEEILPSDDEELGERTKAATKIQAAYRGYRTRKSLKKPPVVIESTNDVSEPHQTADAVQVEEEAPQAKSETPRVDTPLPKRPERMTYTISITTGNRWGAETEADLYVQLFGDEMTSRRFYLQQEAEWLQSGDARFRQRHMDSFHIETEDLGTINQIIIGHEEEGYGAGIFIDYVLITENLIDGRQFVCYCSKWLDSGQVDGKIERTLPVAAFYYLNSVPDETMTSQGRWEFILHNGMEDGTGGTTSNLHIIGYGTTGSSMMHIKNDKTMSVVPDTTLIQVDFGPIGDLLKVRFEADGAGDQPDYYLEWIELRDLDTDERIAVRVGKWMDITGKHTKKPQAFREISVFRSGDQPLEIQNYEGKVMGGDMSLVDTDKLQAQLIGDFSDSGVFPLIHSKKKEEYSFKVECVHLGRINGIKIIGDFSEKGQAILEGFSVLQDIWDKHVGSVETASEILAVSALVRESTHCPYRYVLKESKIRELDENKNYFKVLRFTDMEGLSTRNKKHNLSAEKSDWLLDMSVVGRPEIIPEVSICSGYNAYPMELQSNESGDSQYTYEIKGSSVDTLQKLRIGVGEMENNERFYIKKMRLVNQTTKTVLRFPSVDTEFESNQVYEFSPVYPDVQPALNILYTVTLMTTASTGTFRPSINIIGEEGDSGMRKFYDNIPYAEGSKHSFDADAVNLGPLQDVEVVIEGDENASWSVNISIGITDNGMQYSAELANIPAPGQLVRLPLSQR